MHRVAPEPEFAAAPPTAPRAEIVAADDTPDLALLRLVRALAVQAARDAFAAVTGHTESDAATVRRSRRSPMGRKPLADPLCLPLKRWPEPDRAAWIAAQKPAGLFDDIGPAGEWRPATWFKTEKGYGRFLGWLARYRPNELAREPAERLREEIFSAYLDHLGESTAGYSSLSYVEDLIRALRIISGRPPPNWLDKLQKRLRARARPVRDKRQYVIAADELVRCGIELMRRAETATDWSARRRAVAYRDGLAVALLAYRPIRMKNSRGCASAPNLFAKAAYGAFCSQAMTPRHISHSRRPFRPI